MVKKYNISVPKKYFKGNEEKTLWQNCGTMTEFIKEDGSISRIIEIPAIGLNANVFPFEEKSETPRPQRPAPRQMTPEEEYNQHGSKTEMVDEVIDSSEIPY